MQPNPHRKQLTLSPETMAALKLPLKADGNKICDPLGRYFGEISSAYLAPASDKELAAFIAALVNEALTRELPDAFAPAPEWASAANSARQES